MEKIDTNNLNIYRIKPSDKKKIKKFKKGDFVYVYDTESNKVFYGEVMEYVHKDFEECIVLAQSDISKGTFIVEEPYFYLYETREEAEKGEPRGWEKVTDGSDT